MVLGYKIDQKWHFERSLVKPIRPLGRNIARKERERKLQKPIFSFFGRFDDRTASGRRREIDPVDAHHLIYMPKSLVYLF